jgi:hypothetical protein
LFLCVFLSDLCASAVNAFSLLVAALAALCSLKIDLGPLKQATGFLELSNVSKDRPWPLEAGHRVFEIIERCSLFEMEMLSRCA